ncbi:MAG: 2-hydroxy-3-oxopropionate reductase [Bacilli bacterium]|nr:2-hydroxy-3-oxopropionate reductase [Bacilli bacterium]
MKIGFIGLGIMGKPMAKNLLKHGYELHVHNRSSLAAEELELLGASAHNSPKEVAQAAELVITMVPDSPDVKLVILGPHGVIEGISADKIVVDMSSINPLVSKEIAKQLAVKGAHFLDAPVSGGEIGAIEAKLAIMAGGEQAIFDRVLPVFEKLGTAVTRVGDIGAGNTVKLLNQIIVAINIAGMSEALALGKKAGLDPTIIYNAIRGGLAGSRVMDTKIQNIADEQFKPGFRINLHAKDLTNAIAFGNQVDAKLEFTDRIMELFKQLMEEGYGAEDHSALFRTFL